MAVVVDEFTTMPAEPPAQRGTEESHEGGGGDQGSSPEHDVTKVMELQASRSERIRAY